MKHKLRVILLAAATLLILSVAAWYIITDYQTIEKNRQQASSPYASVIDKQNKTSHRKFVQYTSDTHVGVYIANVIEYHEASLSMSGPVETNAENRNQANV